MRSELVDLINFSKSLYGNSDFIPLHEPCFTGDENRLVNECLDSTFVSSVGKFVDQFEKELADFTGIKHVVVTSSGTSALHISLLLAGVESNTEVITQSLSFVATCNAITYCGAEPIFVDVDRKTLGLSADSLSEFLHKYAKIEVGHCINKLTKKTISACVPMHTFGHPCEIDQIKEICNKWSIPLVEDAAESLGSQYKERYTGTFGLLSAISFNGNKIITAGGGGAILTNDTKLAKRAKHLTTTAKTTHKWEFKHDEVGYNYRMPNLNAALLCAQLSQLQCYVDNKRDTASKYSNFCKTNKIELIEEPNNARSNYWLNTLLLNNYDEQQEFLEYANSHGLMSRPAWTLLTELPMFSGCFSMPQITAKFLSQRLVNIPSSVRL